MTAAVTVQLEGVEAAVALFDRKARFVGRPMSTAGREMAGAVKDDIAGEIAGQYYLAGGRDSWARTVPIGDLAGGRQALLGFGRRWASASPRITANAVELQISAPGAGAHVGGKGTRRGTTRGATIIRASAGKARSMSGAIARKTGGFISPATISGKGLRLSHRPHANPDNPTTARKTEVILTRGFEKA